MLKVVLALGATQMLAWATYYIPAILADPIAHDLATSPNTLFAAFSVSLLVSALLGPAVGRHIDVLGGRGLLALSNVAFALGLALMGLAHGPAMLFTAWAILGIAMSLGLYDAAFAALSRLYGLDARMPITGVTLMGGLASTTAWPLTAWGVGAIGWRETCFAWAAAHLLLALPLNLAMIPRAGLPPRGDAPAVRPHVPMDRRMWLLAFAFAAGWMVTAAMAAHMPRLIVLTGASYADAVFAASLLGPAQVLARLSEVTLARHLHPLTTARLAALGHPIGAALLGLVGSAMAVPFSLLHGAGNGILTIARGTVPLAVFGPENYGYRIGLLGAPARIAQAFAPLLFGLLIDRYGFFASVVLTSAMSLAALAALLLVPATPLPAAAPAGDAP